MRRTILLLALAAGALLSARAVLAADLLVKAPGVEGPAPIPGWAGFYVGANAGYSRAKADLTAADFSVAGVSGTGTVSSVSVPGATFANLTPSGPIAGAQAGYNWQSSYWVYGLEADFQWSGEKDSSTTTGPATLANGTTSGTTAALCFGDTGVNTQKPCTLTNAAGTSTLSAKIDWFGTFRGRIGIAGDFFYWYGTGGLAYGQVKFAGAASFSGGTFTGVTNCASGCPASGSAGFADSAMGLGWTLGTGVEGSMPFWGNWTWRAEYLFVDLGRISPTTTYRSSVSITNLTIPPVSAPLSHTAVVMDHVLRLGINYRFGGGPVVAAY
jgi:outer membrane immunogenic protein